MLDTRALSAQVKAQCQSFITVVTFSNLEADSLAGDTYSTNGQVYSRDDLLFGSPLEYVGKRREEQQKKVNRANQLVSMKANHETDEGSSQVIQQEDLQEWLDNLQLRLHQPSVTAASPSHGPARNKERRATSWKFPHSSNAEEDDYQIK